MKLQNLKPRLGTTNTARVQALPPSTTERKRGWAGVQDRIRIRQRDRGECQACKRAGRFGLGGPIDHIVPLFEGGSDDDNNKELLCVRCHDAKSARETTRRAGGT